MRSLCLIFELLIAHETNMKTNYLSIKFFNVSMLTALFNINTTIKPLTCMNSVAESKSEKSYETEDQIEQKQEEQRSALENESKENDLEEERNNTDKDKGEREANPEVEEREQQRLPEKAEEDRTESRAGDETKSEG